MLRLLLLLLLALAAAPAARAQAQAAPPVPAQAAAPPPAAAAAPPLTPAQAQAAIEVLRDDTKRAQLLGVLESIAKVLPARDGAAAPAAPPAPAKPAAAPAPAKPAAPPPAAETAIKLAPDSLGAAVLVGASQHLSALSADVVDTTRALTDFPLVARWLRHLVRNREARAEVIETAWKLAIIMAIAVAAERIAVRLLRRPIAAIAARAPAALPDAPPPRAAPPAGTAERKPWAGRRPHRAPWGHPERPRPDAAEAARARRHTQAVLLWRRLPYVLARGALELVPLLALVSLGYLLLSTPLAAPQTTRLVILAMLNAYLLTRLVVVLSRVLLAPDTPRLRLVPLADAEAGFTLRWVRRIAIIAIFGYALAAVSLLFGLYRVADDALLKLVTLAVHLCLVVIVLQRRRQVADWIRGRPGLTGPLAALRNRFARVWHIIAIFYILALWLVWAFEVPDGFTVLVRIFVSTFVVVTVSRLLIVAAVSALDRALRVRPDLAARYPGLERSTRRYHPVARATVSGLILALAMVVLLQAWGVDSFGWFAADALGGRLLSALVSIALTVLIALAAWEAANAAVQQHLARLSREAQAARAARLRTLLPMFRSALMVTICLIAGLIVLSDIGVNIAPLLAGAGVLGIAIGFGSQKLVQDLITGLFLLLENTMQVGDVVTLGGLSGVVENLSVRTIRLRALDGSVHIVPFSAVTTVTNMTRDYGYAVLDISVGLNEDPDHVAEVVRAVAAKLRSEPRWASVIRDDLEVLGVEKFVDLAYVLRARIQTLPGERWNVKNEFNRRIKHCFDTLAIESPITSFRALGMAHDPAAPAPVDEEAH